MPFLIGIFNFVAGAMLIAAGGNVWLGAVNFFLSGANIVIGIYERER